MADKSKQIAAVTDSGSDEEGTEAANGLDHLLPLEKLNLGPQKKLLVLCLGDFLVRRVHVKDRHTVRAFTPDVTHGKFLVFKRPLCTEFMKFCFDRFVVGLWSSARDHNIDAILSCVTGYGNRHKLAFVWTQEECEDSGFYCLENEDKPIFLKHLKDLWKRKYPIRLPWRDGQYSASNTLLIDTEPHVSLLNPVDSAIFPHPYKKPNLRDTFLGRTGELRNFLEGVADADDVPTYVKEHRIGQPPITPLHPNWEYYKKVVRRFDKK